MPTNPDDPNDTFPLKFRTLTKREVREFVEKLYGTCPLTDDVLEEFLRDAPEVLVDPAEVLFEEWKKMR